MILSQYSFNHPPARFCSLEFAICSRPFLIFLNPRKELSLLRPEFGSHHLFFFFPLAPLLTLLCGNAFLTFFSLSIPFLLSLRFFSL
jgi:hypothetical protein